MTRFTESLVTEMILKFHHRFNLTDADVIEKNVEKQTEDLAASSDDDSTSKVALRLRMAIIVPRKPSVTGDESRIAGLDSSRP